MKNIIECVDINGNTFCGSDFEFSNRQIDNRLTTENKLLKAKETLKNILSEADYKQIHEIVLLQYTDYYNLNTYKELGNLILNDLKD